MFDTQTMRALSRLSQSGSFRKTAQALGVSPPTLTRMVKSAESAVGYAIFQRSRSGVTLTRLGQQVLEQCEHFLLELERFERSIRQIRLSGGGQLAIGCGPLPTTTIIKPLICALTERWPDIQVSVQVNADIDPAAALREQRLDLFVGDLTHTTAYEELEITQLRRYEMSIVAAPDHPILARAPCDLADLVQFPTALPFLHRYWRKTFETHIQRAVGVSFAPGPALQQITCDDFVLLIELAKTGRFVTGGTPEHFQDAIATGSLVHVPMKTPVPWNLCLARHRGNTFKALDFAWHWLETEFASL